MTRIIPVILCGGSGTRLWPLSRDDMPKQFLRLLGDFSPLQMTARRAMRLTGAKPDEIVTISLESLALQATQHLNEIDVGLTRHIITEPCARNTAAAFATAATYIERIFGPETLILMMPSDHVMKNEDVLKMVLSHAALAANNGAMVVFTTTPTRPETGYGYVKKGKPCGPSTYHAAHFLEKPGLAKAQELMNSGEYFWSMGLHLFRADAVLDQYRNYAPVILNLAAHPNGYPSIPKEPFEKAVLEKSSNVVMVPCALEWSDIGSFQSLWECLPRDHNGNTVLQSGNSRIIATHTKNSFFHTDKNLVVAIGLENIAVIQTQDALLVKKLSAGEDLKTVTNTLKETGAVQIRISPRHDHVWGSYEILSKEDDLQTAKITINADGLYRLPARSSKSIWVVIKGQGCASIDGATKNLRPGHAETLPAHKDIEIFNNGSDTLILHEYLYIEKRQDPASGPIAMAAE